MVCNDSGSLRRPHCSACHGHVLISGVSTQKVSVVLARLGCAVLPYLTLGVTLNTLSRPDVSGEDGAQPGPPQFDLIKIQETFTGQPLFS